MSIPKGTYNKEFYDKVGKFYRTFNIGNGANLKFKGSDKLYTLKAVKTADPRWIFCTDRQTQLGDFLKDITKLESINNKPVVFDWSVAVTEMAKFKQKKEVLPPAYKKLVAELTQFKQTNPSKEVNESGTYKELETLVMRTEGKDAGAAEFKIKNMVRAEMDRQYKAVMRKSMQEQLVKQLEKLTGNKVVLEGLENENKFNKLAFALNILPEFYLEDWKIKISQKVSPNELLGEIHEVLNDYDREQVLGKTFESLSVVAKKVYKYLKSNPTIDLSESFHHNLIPVVLEDYINNTFYVYDDDNYRGTITIEEVRNLDKQRYVISYNAMTGVVTVLPTFEQTEENTNRASEIKNELTKVVTVPRKKKVKEETSTTSQGNYSTAEMENFLKTIVNNIDFKGNGVRITIPSDFPSSVVCTADKFKVYHAWDAAKGIYKEDASWFIWDASIGGSLNKPKMIRAQRYDMQSLLDIAAKYPESVRGFNIGVTSDMTKKAAQTISTKGD